MLPISLRQLECFVATAEAGTMAGGALQCDASPSAVSMAITELEKRLKVQLLIRQQAKGVSLTEVGRKVLTDARVLLSQADDLIANALHAGSEVSGNLSVGCFTTLAPFFVPALLDEFSASYPQLHLTVVEGARDHLYEALMRGQTECAVLYDRGIPSDLSYTVIRTSRPYISISAAHPLASRETINLAELEGEPLIALDVAPSLQNSEELLQAAGIQPTIFHRSPSIEMVRSLVGRGLGYSIMVQPWPTTTSFESRELATIQIADDIVEHRVVIAYPQGAKLTRRAQAFIQFCHAYL